MKSQNRCKKKTNKNAISTMKIANSHRTYGKRNKKQKSQLCQKYRRPNTIIVQEAGPSEYIFYAILNTYLRLEQGTAAAAIADGLMSLYCKLDIDDAKAPCIDSWIKDGRRILILKGYDHKHLKYLKDEVEFMAAGVHVVHQSVGRSKQMVMLAVFGQREDLEDVFEGLTYLR